MNSEEGKVDDTDKPDHTENESQVEQFSDDLLERGRKAFDSAQKQITPEQLDAAYDRTRRFGVEAVLASLEAKSAEDGADFAAAEAGFLWYVDYPGDVLDSLALEDGFLTEAKTVMDWINEIAKRPDRQDSDQSDDFPNDTSPNGQAS